MYPARLAAPRARLRRSPVPKLVALTTSLLAATGVAALPPAQQDLYASYDAETQAAIDAELADCPACSLETLADGSPNVVESTAEPSVGVLDLVSQGAVVLADPGSSPSTCMDSGSSLSKTASYDKTLGNSLAGLYWRTRSDATTTPLSSNTARRYTAHAEQAVGGKLLTFSFDVARAEADALAETSGARRLTSRLLARSTSTGLLQNVATRSSSVGGAVRLEDIATNRTWWGGSKTFLVGPVPVNVSTYLRGQASHKVNGNTSATEAAVTGHPNASIYVDASASVEAVVAAVGADAQLTLLSGSVPNTARMTRNTNDYGWSLTSNAVFNALSGYVKAWVRIGYWKLSKTWRHTVAQWSGFTWNQGLFSNAGAMPRCGLQANPVVVTGTVSTLR
ncbi:MAG: hypothetical protein IT382_24520 [Deltaproteobacteria bacterium]|nr:hypothetical protein [Deltaproteobacteria bacterium]